MVQKLKLSEEIIHRLKQNHQDTKKKQAKDGDEPDHFPVVKIWFPFGDMVWLITEMLDDDDTMFGLCDPAMGFPELGYVSLEELTDLLIQVHFVDEEGLETGKSAHLPLEIHKGWVPLGTISQYATKASNHQCFVELWELQDKEETS